MNIEKMRRKEGVELRRTLILQAARCVFARQGYKETVVDDIATQAGIAKGTLYLYFRSKEEIYHAALLEDARRLNVQTRHEIAAAGTWQEKIQAYLRVRIEYLDSHQDFLRLYLAEIRSMMVRGVRLECEFYDVLRDGEELLAQVFSSAIARGEIRDVDPSLAAMTVVDVVRGCMERRLLGWCPNGKSSDGQFSIDLICRALSHPQAS